MQQRPKIGFFTLIKQHWKWFLIPMVLVILLVALLLLWGGETATPFIYRL